MPTPAAEVEVDTALVRALLVDQHPDLADRPLAVVASGWDNVVVRLGADLAVRMPRRSAAAVLVEHEQRWLPELARLVGAVVPVPVPLRAGRPALGYPWAWSVVPWFPGRTLGSVAGGPGVGEALADFVSALHVPAPDDAPPNAVRAVPPPHADGRRPGTTRVRTGPARRGAGDRLADGGRPAGGCRASRLGAR
ncbi:phosphotransferase [Curtobacterium sp. MCPF17_052]|uniref:phosphotransferase n=1 Tax=Curtobacterium sp. MCPF17_052 TaxID=2175655 RepID=UPI0024E00BA0|nr:phosphotransferase [Curtobacterium sp. MCPF17_052]WIB13810.1 phosphotransferase [Curtobacterium sp. MCPF17_052]